MIKLLVILFIKLFFFITEKYYFIKLYPPYQYPKVRRKLNQSITIALFVNIAGKKIDGMIIVYKSKVPHLFRELTDLSWEAKLHCFTNSE